MLSIFKGADAGDKYNSRAGCDVCLYALRYLIVWSGILMLRSHNPQ